MRPELKYGFGVSSKPFFVRYAKRIILLAVVLVIMLSIQKAVLFAGTTIPKLLLMMVITAVIPNAVFWLVYHHSDEYACFQSIIKDRELAPIRRKLHKCSTTSTPDR